MVDYFAPEIVEALKANPPLPRKGGYDALVRLIDILAAVTALLVFGPLMLVLALAIRLGDGGPVFFRQERMGKGGKGFRIFKFRSMVVNAEQSGAKWRMTKDDRRVTRVGKILREFHLDELPQLFNVLAGEMSLVGPRPEVPRYVARYTPAQRRVLDLPPGITDPASIKYRDENAVLARAADPDRAYVDEIMPEKLRLNLAYADRRSLAGDVVVILHTLARLLR